MRSLVPNRAPDRRPAPRCRSSRGFAAVEAVVVMGILIVAFLSTTSTLVGVQALTASDRDRRVATAALASVVGDVRRAAAASVDAESSWGEALVAIYGAGGVPGNAIDVAGLEAFDDLAVCTIEIVTDETLTDAELGVELGLPRDLDNDGAVDNADVTATARMLPVIVRMQWRSRGGVQRATRGFYVLGY